MSLTAFSFVLVLFLDALGYFSLWLANWTTNEVRAVFFIVPIVVGMALFRLGARISSKVLFLTFAALFILVGLAIFRMHYQVQIVLTAALPSFHALVFLSTDRSRFRYWRLGVSLFEIMLGTSTAPEFYMFFLVTIYSLLALFLLSLFYLEASYLAHDEQLAEQRIPRSFIKASTLLALLIFVTAGILFPILPRSTWFEGYDMNRSLVGYSEKIEIAKMDNFFDSGPPKIVMRFFLPKDQDAFPLHLIRGRALEVYNGTTWLPAVKRPDLVTTKIGGNHIHVVREDIGSDVLPVPYGTNSVRLDDGRGVKRVISKEWSEHFSGKHTRTAYTIELSGGLSWSPLDTPREIMVQVPDPSQRIHRLAAELGRGAKTEREKFRNLFHFFQKNKFTASLTLPASVGGEPIDNFLFQTKIGHCELFATAAALLLRAMNIPTRLVVGFRASRNPENGVLNVYNSDAHAWLEAWTSDKGWIPLDPTPLVFRAEGHHWLEDKYELLSAFWYRYILSYDADARKELINFLEVNSLKLAKLVLELVGILLLILAIRRIMRKLIRYWHLPRQRKLARRIYRKYRGKFPAAVLPTYEILRFGKLLSDEQLDEVYFKANESPFKPLANV